MTTTEFNVLWNQGRRFPTGPEAEKEFLDNRYYIGFVRIVKTNKVVLYKGRLPIHTPLWVLKTRTRWTDNEKTLQPELVRKVPVFTWRLADPSVKPTEMCDLRFPYDESICRHFPTCIPAINKLSLEQLKALHHTLHHEPWLLCFWRYMKQYKDMGTLAPANCLELMPSHCDPVIQTAMQLLHQFQQQQTQNGDTLFRGTFLGDAVQFLQQHGGVEVGPRGITLTKDAQVGRYFRQALERLCAASAKCKERGAQVPCKPQHPLTEEQRAFALHVLNYPLALLNAPPGCGKTETIVWINSQFENVLNVTYVGSMVEALQRRLGNHTGLVHTIHYIITVAKHVEEAREWLACYEVLVVDEASNVDEKLLSDLLRVLPNLRKLILIGDLDQIFPIDPGCPFFDLVQHAQKHTFRLTRNLRVDPAFCALADANAAIREGNVDQQRICFNSDGDALYRLDSPMDGTKTLQSVKQVLRTCLERMESTMHTLLDFQLLTMRNDDRQALNAACEQMLFDMKLLKKPLKKDSVKLTFQTALFAGKKISFTKTRKSTVKGGKHYEGVRNGELALVRHATLLKGGDIRLETTTGKLILISKTQKDAVQPNEIVDGYCITCNKSQGSEWPHIVLWMPQHHMPFTREFPYVGFSRARRSMTMVGSMDTLQKMCAQKARPRETLVRHWLPEVLDALKPTGEPVTGLRPLDMLTVVTPDKGIKLFPVVTKRPKQPKQKRQKTIGEFVK